MPDTARNIPYGYTHWFYRVYRYIRHTCRSTNEVNSPTTSVSAQLVSPARSLGSSYRAVCRLDMQVFLYRYCSLGVFVLVYTMASRRWVCSETLGQKSRPWVSIFLYNRARRKGCLPAYPCKTKKSTPFDMIFTVLTTSTTTSLTFRHAVSLVSACLAPRFFSSCHHVSATARSTLQFQLTTAGSLGAWAGPVPSAAGALVFLSLSSRTRNLWLAESAISAAELRPRPLPPMRPQPPR
jgi:hypothetical protein